MIKPSYYFTDARRNEIKESAAYAIEIIDSLIDGTTVYVSEIISLKFKLENIKRIVE